MLTSLDTTATAWEAIVDLVGFSKDTFGEEKNKLSLRLTLKLNNTGALDEENNESAHADMNNVQSLFGASRGDNQKMMMIDDYSFGATRNYLLVGTHLFHFIKWNIWWYQLMCFTRVCLDRNR